MFIYISVSVTRRYFKERGTQELSLKIKLHGQFAVVWVFCLQVLFVLCFNYMIAAEKLSCQGK